MLRFTASGMNILTSYKANLRGSVRIIRTAEDTGRTSQGRIQDFEKWSLTMLRLATETAWDETVMRKGRSWFVGRVPLDSEVPSRSPIYTAHCQLAVFDVSRTRAERVDYSTKCRWPTSGKMHRAGISTGPLTSDGPSFEFSQDTRHHLRAMC